MSQSRQDGDNHESSVAIGPPPLDRMLPARPHIFEPSASGARHEHQRRWFQRLSTPSLLDMARADFRTTPRSSRGRSRPPARTGPARRSAAPAVQATTRMHRRRAQPEPPAERRRGPHRRLRDFEVLTRADRLETLLRAWSISSPPILCMGHGAVTLIDSAGDATCASPGLGRRCGDGLAARLPQAVIDQIVATAVPYVVHDVARDPLFARSVIAAGDAPSPSSACRSGRFARGRHAQRSTGPSSGVALAGTDADLRFMAWWPTSSPDRPGCTARSRATANG